MRKFCNGSRPLGQTANISSIYVSHSNGLLYRVKGKCLKMLMKVLLTMGDRKLSIAMPSFVGRTYRPFENR
jgi:hypothetical protein